MTITEKIERMIKIRAGRRPNEEITAKETMEAAKSIIYQMVQSEIGLEIVRQLVVKEDQFCEICNQLLLTKEDRQRGCHPICGSDLIQATTPIPIKSENDSPAYSSCPNFTKEFTESQKARKKK